MANRLHKDVTLMDLIKVYKKAIPDQICKNIIKREEENARWKKHEWSVYNEDTFVRTDISNDFVQQKIGSLSKLEVMPRLNDCIKNYVEDNSMHDRFTIGGVTLPNLNKYELGTAMAPHYDHIYSIFDGAKRGIPVLSIVALLNNDFAGGEFVFWKDEVINLEAGDILMFPSLFAYSHRVNIITKGTRYSVVSWAY